MNIGPINVSGMPDHLVKEDFDLRVSTVLEKWRVEIEDEKWHPVHLTKAHQRKVFATGGATCLLCKLILLEKFDGV